MRASPAIVAPLHPCARNRCTRFARSATRLGLRVAPRFVATREGSLYHGVDKALQRITERSE